MPTEYLSETAVLIDGDVRPRADILDDLEEVPYESAGVDEHAVYNRQPHISRRLGSDAVTRVVRPIVAHRELDWRERQFKD
jgi:hypothetical protein